MLSALDAAPWDDEPLTPVEAEDIRQGMRDIRLGKAHTLAEWDDLEADGVLCLGFAKGQAGSHANWPDLLA
jgi:hypothetical protein